MIGSARRPFRVAASLGLAAVIVLTVTGSRARAAGVHVEDLYFAAGYERQVDGRTCTAAAIAMMANFIAGRDLDLDQLRILRYEQERDALNDRVQRGSDPLGWSRAATDITRWLRMPTAYAWVAYSNKGSALRYAAWSIARFGKPVGLLTRHGRHAVVMTGFEATADPTRGGSWRLLAIYVSDPLGPRRARYGPGNAPLDRYLELDATPIYDRAWYGRLIMIVPRN